MVGAYYLLGDPVNDYACTSESFDITVTIDGIELMAILKPSDPLMTELICETAIRVQSARPEIKINASNSPGSN